MKIRKGVAAAGAAVLLSGLSFVSPAFGAPTGGANTTVGPYDSLEGYGTEPGNGSENGNATGQPCAGCVGKADLKNPPGQMPDGSDNNAGYECDRNQGIGQMNPAHTGCLPDVTVV